MVRDLQKMAIELLRGKGDMEDLSINWTQDFLRRHPDLKSRFVPLLDQDRVLIEDLSRFFGTLSSSKLRKPSTIPSDTRYLIVPGRPQQPHIQKKYQIVPCAIAPYGAGHWPRRLRRMGSRSLRDGLTSGSHENSPIAVVAVGRRWARDS
jgi:hypothetical protein